MSLDDIDSDTIEDVLAALEEHHEKIEESLHALRADPGNADLLHGMFRAIHSVKGNAAMCELTPLVEFTHALEEVISALRAKRLRYTEAVSEVLLLGMDRLRDLHLHALRGAGAAVPDAERAAIQEALQALAQSNAAQAEAAAQTVLARLGGELPQPVAETTAPAPQAEDLGRTDAQREDLAFFRRLGQQVDALTPYWSGRSDTQLRLALRMNELAGKPLAPAQLMAAVYLHDVGMAFLPGDLINKTGKLNPLELRQLQSHPTTGWEIARRMPGWSVAAEAVLQHHEREDGEGYPNRLRAEQIGDGAKILAILDAYFAMTHERADRNHKRSILRAVSEINARAGSQFSADWVRMFNQAIRQEAREGQL